MYDDPRDPTYAYWLDEEPVRPRPADRLRHLVFLDGLLVDVWSEPVERTEYAHLALEADDRMRRATPAPAPSPRPDHEQLLDWLDCVVGGRTALLAPHDRPWTEGDRDEPPGGAADHPSYDAAVDLLERVAGDLFRDDEVFTAAHHLLDRVWRDDPELLASRRTVPQVAGGVLWVVGKANGLFGQAPTVRQMDVQRALWLKQPLSTTGQTVARAVQRIDLPAARRPWRLPPLEPYGDARLLVAGTRRTLIGWRDRALESQRQHRADEKAKGARPPEVGS